MSQFNEQDIEAIRSGVMGAVALVSQAEPGFFATFKESMAASKALAEAPQEFRQLVTGGMVMPPKASGKEQMQTQLLDNLTTAVRVASQDPATLQALTQYVTAACQEVAQAAKGVSPEEQDMIGRIGAILDQAGNPSQTQAFDPTRPAPAQPGQQQRVDAGDELPGQVPQPPQA